MPIISLQIKDVGLFDKIDFEFDPQINVFVGPNNCGKTTTLFTIADIAVHPFDFPGKHVHLESAFSVSLQSADGNERLSGLLPIAVGKSPYWTDERFSLIERAQAKLGFTSFTPALRVGTDFRSEGPKVNDVPEDDYETPDLVSSYIRDESIIQDLVNLDYQAYRDEKPAIRATIELIASTASQITEGFPLKFSGVKEEHGGLVPCFETPDGRMPLNVLSQGTQGLVLWLTRFIIGYAKYYEFPQTFSGKPGILIIDEIDAHLHPSWQRRILPVLTTAFPSLQIFCSTHSPLLIAGLKKGQVQLLRRGDNGKVTVTQNDTDVNGWTADEIYSCFLDVKNPTDLATDNRLGRIKELRDKKSLAAAEKKELEGLRKQIGIMLRSTPSSSEEGLSSAVDELTRAAKNLAKKAKPVLAKKVKK